MKSSNLLNLGNPRKVKENRSPILKQDALDAIEAEIERHSVELCGLGFQHYRFAVKLPRQHWRQRVSRLYYAAYAVSRALRLYVWGEYSAEAKDHQRIGHLPDDFPGKARLANQLPVLREDRNTCDYDHASRAVDLLIPTSDAVQLVREFLAETKSYLKAKGLEIRGGP